MPHVLTLRLTCFFLGSLLLAATPSGAQDSSSSAARGVPFESVRLDDGREYTGLIERASGNAPSDTWLYLNDVRHGPGGLAYLIVRPLLRARVKETTLLPPTARARLTQEVARLRFGARIELPEAAAIVLTTQTDKNGSTRHVYQGRWFTLDSQADAATTRRVAARLEQVFAAYRLILPPRVEPARRPRVCLFGSMTAYQARLRELGLRLANEAVFHQQENVVLAGSPLDRYAAEMAKIAQQHAQQTKEIKDLEEKLPTRLKDLADRMRRQGNASSVVRSIVAQEKQRAQAQINAHRKELARLDRENAQAMDRITRELSVRLAHETFHAYLENYVYPAEKHDVPMWLNEGLAMVFESSLVEGDMLHLGVPHRAALKRLQEDLRGTNPLKLTELLAAGPNDFLVGPDERTEASNRYYCHAWGLVYYLLFDKQRIDLSKLDDYMSPRPAHENPLHRFEILSGKTTDVLQSQWRRHILSLR
ncbi:MAG: DUF1570 domain-containing protein [Pirellulales bacterium]|nr:DUF1570 domain-containing protein [Pirellulales bacterium]